MTRQWGLADGRGVDSQRYLPAPLETEAAELELWRTTSCHDGLLHPAVVVWHLRVLRALGRHTLAHLEGAGGDAILAGWRQELGDVDYPHPEAHFLLGQDAPSTVEAAWTYYGGFLDAGLSAFAVHVRLGPAVVGLASSNLFTAGCLQLAQYLASESTIGRCANERCVGPFIRQRGRAHEEYGQHRSRGVRYCSNLCAKSQSERDRRRRRAEESGR